jgi:hypothetical protein
MTITNYTFFSPNGDDFPVTANADAKLYMMLTGMSYDNYRVKFWKNPINTALNRVYVNTSIVAGGRYFELTDHAVTLFPESTNYVHAVIELANTSNPVTLTVEKTNTSNNTDINNDSGVLKVCFDIVVTNSSQVTSASRPAGQTATFDKIVANDEEIKTASGSVNIGNGVTCNWQRKGELVNVRWSGSLSSINQNTYFSTPAPAEIRPNATKELIGHFAGGDLSFHIDLEPDGRFKWWGRNGATGTPRGSAVYFIK